MAVVDKKAQFDFKMKAFGIEFSVILPIILTFVLTILGSIFTTWWFSKEPHLTKRVSDLLAFQGEKGEVGILNVNLSSDGTKEADEVTGYVEIKDSVIEDVRIIPRHLSVEKTIKGGVLNVSCKSLIPGESLQIAVLAKKSVGLPPKPYVECRAKGIVAEEREFQQAKPTFGQLLLSNGLAGIILGLAFSAVIWLFAIWFIHKLRSEMDRASQQLKRV